MSNGKLAQVRAFFGLSADDEAYDEYYADQGYEPRRYASEPYDNYYEAPASHRAPAVRDPYAYEDRSSRPVQEPSRTIRVVSVSCYSDATALGNPFRDGHAVVFGMDGLSSEDARRIVDFAAGLGFALHGRMEKLAGRTFALIPEGSTVRRAELLDAAGL